MADRFPLIIDSAEEKIKELVSGDNLDLTGNNIKNADYIQTAEANIAGIVTATKFKGDGSELENLPAAGSSLEATASGTLADGSTVIVNADGTVSAVAQDTVGWLATLGSTISDSGMGIGVDSSGNVYAAGHSYSSTENSDSMLIVKYNNSGVIQWQRNLGKSGSGEYGESIAVDSSGNAYVVGYSQSGGSGGNEILIAKYDTDGNIQWQRTLGGSNYEDGRSIAVDSSSNVYVVGVTQSTGSGSNDFIIAKYNSSGSIQWKRALGGSSSDFAYGISVDGSGNAYVTGYTTSVGSGSRDVIIAKYNTSGSIQWRRVLGGTDSDTGYGISADSSGNVYVTGSTSSTGSSSPDIFIVKYNTLGSIQWQNYLSGAISDVGRGIKVDDSGNVYVVGYSYPGSAVSNEWLIAKYDSDGNLDWQRYLGGTSSDIPESITVDSSGNVYVAGYTASTGAGSNDLLIAKLPSDGSAIGTYGSITYASSSLTPGTLNLNDADASSSLNDNNAPDNAVSSSDSSSEFTDAESNLTESTTNMIGTNLTAENFIGISDGAYTDGQTATIQVIGAVDDAQSSLTPGQAYYVQDDGTLGESGTVFAGTAVAATKLIVKG